MSEIFAVDVGGTFTDVVVLDTETGRTRLAKVPTTPRAPAEGVVDGVRKASVRVGGSPAFFHGTTIGLNTLLERKGARVGLITTEGFRDVLEIGRMTWPMYQLHWQRPEPLVPRYLRCEVRERVDASGSVLVALDEADVRRVVDELVHEGVDCIAVCLLHSYAHPAHEDRIGEIVADAYPELPVTLSHDVAQEYREYERTSTAVADAMIRPVVAGYVRRLDESVRGEGFGGTLFVTRCDGGVMGAPEAMRRSIRTLLSGPASGVMGAVTIGRWLGLENLIAIDMGGTSFDAALVVGGEPILRATTEIDGCPLLMPVVELATIGAGGGSIAWIDSGGALNVGPQSAGADPGPICYGQGGTDPTFTDAALVTGLIDPASFLGGDMRLDVSLAADGIERVIACPLGLSLEEAASGIVAVTEAKMAATIEEITIGKGYDPRDFTLVAYGGGGPLVASSLARRIGIPRTVVPPAPSTFSAWGMLTLDVVQDFSLTRVSPLDLLEPSSVERELGQLAARAADALVREGIERDRQQALSSVDLRYEGQEHTLTVPVGNGPGGGNGTDLAGLRARFDSTHETVYGYSTTAPVELVAYRVRAVGSLPKPLRPEPESGASDTAAPPVRGTREAAHRESGGRIAFAVYDRESIGAGQHIVGPAIVEEATATILVAPGERADADGLGNLVLTAARPGEAEAS